MKHAAALRAALVRSIEQADRGETLDGAEVIRDLRKRLRKRRRPKKRR